MFGFRTKGYPGGKDLYVGDGDDLILPPDSPTWLTGSSVYVVSVPRPSTPSPVG